MTTKISVVAVILISLLAAATFLFSAHDTDKVLQREWEVLLHSPDPEAELQQLKKLTAIVDEQSGYWSAFSIDVTGERVNITNTPNKIQAGQTVELVFRWGETTFTGRDWIPLDNENVFAFFTED